MGVNVRRINPVISGNRGGIEAILDLDDVLTVDRLTRNVRSYQGGSRDQGGNKKSFHIWAVGAVVNHL
jgi:hypothetical protein